MVAVPDSRLGRITTHITTEKVVPAALRLVDIAGLVRGASKGEGLGNQFLSHIRNVDAILHVVRCFEDTDITHVDDSVDPIRDIETIEMELMLSDLQTVEGSINKAKKSARTGDKLGKVRVALLEKCQARLADGRPVRGLELDGPDEQNVMKELALLSAKPVLYVANVDEDDILGEGPLVAPVRERAAAEGGGVVPVCAKIESELTELDDNDRLEMLESLGLTEPALAALARGAYSLLGLQSFFTAGPKRSGRGRCVRVRRLRKRQV